MKTTITFESPRREAQHQQTLWHIASAGRTDFTEASIGQWKILVCEGCLKKSNEKIKEKTVM